MEKHPQVMSTFFLLSIDRYKSFIDLYATFSRGWGFFIKTSQDYNETIIIENKPAAAVLGHPSPLF